MLPYRFDILVAGQVEKLAVHPDRANSSLPV